MIRNLQCGNNFVKHGIFLGNSEVLKKHGILQKVRVFKVRDFEST